MYLCCNVLIGRVVISQRPSSFIKNGPTGWTWYATISISLPLDLKLNRFRRAPFFFFQKILLSFIFQNDVRNMHRLSFNFKTGDLGNSTWYMCFIFWRRTINNRRKDVKMLRLKTASKSHTFAYFLTLNGLIWAFDFLSVQKPLASAYAANADKFLNIPWSQYSRHLTIVAHVFMK